MTFQIEWNTGVGYGDFVTGLGYAYTSRIRYQRPVQITFHWKNSKSFLYHKSDPETIVDRCNFINSTMVQDSSVHVVHNYNSKIDFRFYNQLEEFNPLHGLWYYSKPLGDSKTVVLWTTDGNLEFPGTNKDPVNRDWYRVKNKLNDSGYDVVEVTYRTPVKDVVELISNCSFGVGYDGLAHQIFKFMWKPLIVFCERKELNSLLVPQAVLEDDVDRFVNSNIDWYVNKSKTKVENVKQLYSEYLNRKEDPSEHRLYNTFIY